MINNEDLEKNAKALVSKVKSEAVVYTNVNHGKEKSAIDYDYFYNYDFAWSSYLASTDYGHKFSMPVIVSGSLEGQLNLFADQIDDMLSAERSILRNVGVSGFVTIAGILATGGPITWLIGLIAAAGFIISNIPGILDWLSAKSSADDAWLAIDM